MDKQKSSVHIIQGTRRIWEWSCLACHHQWKDNTTQDGRLWQGGCRVWPEVPALEPKLWGQGSLHRHPGDLVLSCIQLLDWPYKGTSLSGFSSCDSCAARWLRWASFPYQSTVGMGTFSVSKFFAGFLPCSTNSPMPLSAVVSMDNFPTNMNDSLKRCSSNPLAAKAVLEWKLVVRGGKKSKFLWPAPVRVDAPLITVSQHGGKMHSRDLCAYVSCNEVAG